MSDAETIELRAVGVRFYSEHDEGAFFEWLSKLACIEKCEGHGRILSIFVKANLVDEAALRELLSLFRRYGVELRQLGCFDRPEFSDWFRNPKSYWYKAIFG